MKSLLLRSVIVLALFALVVPVALVAQDAALKQRMVQRLLSIQDLKTRKVVGENNRGLLEARRTATPAEASLVEEENRDRDAVYAEIARQQGTTKEAVGRTRAAQIAERSPSGLLIQAANGSWAEKP